MIRAISRPFSALSLEVDSTIAPGEAPTAKLDPGQTPPACAHYGNWWVLAAQVGPAERDHMAPLYVNEGLFPPVDDAPVLAVVKQTALDDGCGPALLQVVGNGAKNGLVGPGW